MMELGFFFGVGIAILLLLVLLVLDRVPFSRDRVPIEELQNALAILELQMQSPTVAKRIFALEDWDFVFRRTRPAIQRLFLAERKALAFSWLRNTKRTVSKLMDFHRRKVRRNAALNPFAELVLGLNYLFFLLVCNVLLGMIWSLGPFWARKMALFAADLSEQIAYGFGSALTKLRPPVLQNFKGPGLRGSTGL